MQKTVPVILRIVSMLFLIFEKGITKIPAPDILGFLYILFLIFERATCKNIVPDI